MATTIATEDAAKGVSSSEPHQRGRATKKSILRPGRSLAQRNSASRGAEEGAEVEGNGRQRSKREGQRKPGRKPYPVEPFSEVVRLAEGIEKLNSGLPVKRETLLAKMRLEPGALSTRNLITNSSKYGLTEGSYQAATLKLTERGAAAVCSKTPPREQRLARFALAIENVEPFNELFKKRSGASMPAPEMLHDDLATLDQGDRRPCSDVFISNAKFLGLLVARDGAEYLMTKDEWLDAAGDAAPLAAPRAWSASGETVPDAAAAAGPAVDFDKVCFVISTIREPSSIERVHADAIFSQYVERALDGTGLAAVRADKIGEPGMISKQIIEYLLRSKLVVADLSFHNPNVFYELAVRHVTGKPTVHLSRTIDKPPFDVGNFRTIQIDTNDGYVMVREIDTVRSQISSAIRQALANRESRDNPILTYCPGAKFELGS